MGAFSLIIDNNGHLHFQVNGSKIFIKALYIYVCMPIFIYIFKERQFYTEVRLFSVKRPPSPVKRNAYKVNGIMSVSSVQS